MEIWKGLISLYVSKLLRRWWVRVVLLGGLVAIGVFGGKALPVFLGRTTLNLGSPTAKDHTVFNLFRHIFTGPYYTADAMVVYVDLDRPATPGCNRTVINDDIRYLSSKLKEYDQGWDRNVEGYFTYIDEAPQMARYYVGPNNLTTVFMARYWDYDGLKAAIERAVDAFDKRMKLKYTHVGGPPYYVGVTGKEILLNQQRQRTVADMERSDMYTGPLTFLVLGITLGSPPLMVVPLFTTPLAALMAFYFITPLSATHNFASFSPAIFVSLVLATSIDYSLFLLSRYREEYTKEMKRRRRVRRARRKSSYVVSAPAERAALGQAAGTDSSGAREHGLRPHRGLTVDVAILEAEDDESCDALDVDTVNTDADELEEPLLAAAPAPLTGSRPLRRSRSNGSLSDRRRKLGGPSGAASGALLGKGTYAELGSPIQPASATMTSQRSRSTDPLDPLDPLERLERLERLGHDSRSSPFSAVNAPIHSPQAAAQGVKQPRAGAAATESMGAEDFGLVAPPPRLPRSLSSLRSKTMRHAVTSQPVAVSPAQSARYQANSVPSSAVERDAAEAGGIGQRKGMEHRRADTEDSLCFEQHVHNALAQHKAYAPDSDERPRSPLPTGVFAGLSSSSTSPNDLDHLNYSSAHTTNTSTASSTSPTRPWVRLADPEPSSTKYDDKLNEEAVKAMLEHAGWTVLVSGCTLAGAFLALMVFPYQLISTVGMGAALTLMSVLFVNLTLTPALLLTFGRFFQWQAPRAWRRRWRTVTTSCRLCCMRSVQCVLPTWCCRKSSPTLCVDMEGDALRSPSLNPAGASATSDSSGVYSALASSATSSRHASSSPPRLSTAQRGAAREHRAAQQPSQGTAWHTSRRALQHVPEPVAVVSSAGSGGADTEDSEATIDPLTSPHLAKFSKLPPYKDKSCYAKVARFCQRHPVLTVVAVCALGVPVAVQVKDLSLNFDQNLLLARGTSSVEALHRYDASPLPTGLMQPFWLIGASDWSPERYPNKPTPPGKQSVFSKDFFDASHVLVPMLVDAYIAAGYDFKPNYIHGIAWEFGGPISLENCLEYWNKSSPGYHSPYVTSYRYFLDGQYDFGTQPKPTSYVSYDKTKSVFRIDTPFDPRGAQAERWIDVTRTALKQFVASYDGQFEFVLDGMAVLEEDGMNHVYALFPKFVAISSVLVFVFIALAFRSIMVALRLVVTVAFTLAWVFGAGVIVFQKGAFDWLASDLKDVHFFQWMVPVMTFSILNGLTLDYDVYLISRMYEYRKQGLSDEEAIVRGVDSTGTIITSAGVIMMIAFSSLLVTREMILNQVGFLFVFGVLMDTFVVRTVLVPAIMLIAPQHNWWPSRMPKPQ